tara:strand:- start:123 stop:380 length:258 start_codon:yes stop_codon:yes gene_type:complete
MSDKYVYWRELGDMFKAYTAPKLCRVLDANGIPYRMDAKNKPMVERVHVDSTADAGGETISAAQAMDNMETLIEEFPTSVTVTSE